MTGKILILAGMPGTGKTTAAAFFHKRNIPTVRMGDYLDQVLINKGMHWGEKEEKIQRNKLRKLYGEVIFAKKAMPKILKVMLKGSFVVVEGIRSIAEYLFLKDRFSDTKLLFLTADKRLRISRLKQRKIRPLKDSEAKDRGKDEIGIGLLKLNSLANYNIANNGTKQELYKCLENILNELI